MYTNPSMNKTSRIKNSMSLPYFLPLFPTLALLILSGLRKRMSVSSIIYPAMVDEV